MAESVRRCKVVEVCGERFVVAVDVLKRVEEEGALGAGVPEYERLAALVELEAGGQAIWLSRGEHRHVH